MVNVLADVPADVLVPLADALGVPAPRVTPIAKGFDAATADALASAIRLAADDLDVPASAVRRILAVALPHLTRAAIPLDGVAAALAPAAKPRRHTPSDEGRN
jgi:hypothetical protein